MKDNLEKKYTSTKTKLLHNLHRLNEIQSTGKLRPISIQLAPTDKCNLNCVFCSVKKRDMDELKFEDIKNALSKLRKAGAQTVEITGGGDPTLHPDIVGILNVCISLGFKVGLITNGILLNEKISYNQLSSLSWIRISMNCLDYVDKIELNIPNNVTLGFSYVWNENSKPSIINKIRQYRKIHNAKYIRVVPDCRNVKFIEDYRKSIMPIINEYPDVDGMFFQEKEYVPPSRCWMGYLKPFINADGYIYHCSANPLIDLKFNKKFRMGHISEIDKIWNDKYVIPFTSEHCGECFFKEHNELIEEIILDIEHKDFI